jgi:hypothetical protein
MDNRLSYIDYVTFPKWFIKEISSDSHASLICRLNSLVVRNGCTVRAPISQSVNSVLRRKTRWNREQ